jgi:hypothetical protein
MWFHVIIRVWIWKQNVGNNMRFQVLTAAFMKMIAFWNMAPCRLVDVD